MEVPLVEPEVPLVEPSKSPSTDITLNRFENEIN